MVTVVALGVGLKNANVVGELDLGGVVCPALAVVGVAGTNASSGAE